MELSIKDIHQYITMIRINFENAYKTQTDEERKMLYGSWFAILKNYPKEICDKAVINAIARAEFAPRIGSIVKEIESMLEAYEKTDHELWAELTSVLREVSSCAYAFRYTYREENGLTQGENARNRVIEIFNGLSQELKAYCKNWQGLVEIARQPLDQLKFEQSRFTKVMPQLRERTKMRAQTPGLETLLQGVNTQLLLDGQKNA